MRKVYQFCSHFNTNIIIISITAFVRTHMIIYVVFQSRGFYDVPQILIVDARLCQALAVILD